MLAGEGAIAIWNGISDEGRADFYAWHLSEHMPERVGIPGFLRGRRYRAADEKTHPEFFTLYETQTFEVTQGVDYFNRLNAPTSWTKRATAHFKTTSRSLARVVASFGVGSGGMLLTLRFDVPDEEGERETLASIVMKIAALPEITGAHILKGMTKPRAPRLPRARIARISSNPPAGSSSSKRVRSKRWRARVPR
ncbi:hypothetical protein [Bradyrhizobium sp. RDM4]|uniref:hypothetical protein n=1 Tax=Bradyrhizobium sp. RDM4 TaxID=3378765 RepID=UPI0038FD21C9